MKRNIYTILICLMSFQLIADINVIPQPNQVKEGEGILKISGGILVKVPNEWGKSAAIGLKPLAKHQKMSFNKSSKANITFSKDTGLGEEAYTLNVDSNGIHIKASTEKGIFYATQSLLQLMPSSVFSSKKKLNSIPVKQVQITDEPRFGWRGLMLDASRHFQTVTEVKRFIDLMAMHKLNVFHWHLTDSHGWRIEIKKYPKLTEVGAWRDQPDYPTKGEKGRYGGFYTQEEIKDVIAYAAARQITIVPEIDMPGHSFAAVAAYPEFGGLDKPQHVDYFFTYPADRQSFPSRRGYTDVLAVFRPQTVQFCKDVLDEVMALFPSEYIHIGGDEVEKHVWKHSKEAQEFIKKNNLKGEDGLQSWFIQEIDNYLTSKGRKLMGWDEILQGGLAKNARVMSWQGEQGGIRAAKMGHDVVMSPQTYIYLDHGQSHSPLEPPHWPGHKPLTRVYNYNPIPPQLTVDEAKHILGVQANVWTAFIHEEWKLDLSTWPRASAVAEVAWSAKEVRNYGNFYKRMEDAHFKRLDYLGVNYWRENSLEVATWNPSLLKAGDQEVTMTFDLSDVAKKLGKGKIDFVFSWKKGAHALKISDAALFVDDKVISRDKHDGFTGTTAKKNIYSLDLSKYKGQGKLTLKVKAFGHGGKDSHGVISISEVLTKRVK